jgi:hypothetical protein
MLDAPFFIRSPTDSAALILARIYNSTLQLIAAENTVSNIKKASFWQKICLSDDKLSAADVFSFRGSRQNHPGNQDSDGCATNLWWELTFPFFGPSWLSLDLPRDGEFIEP